MTHYLLCMTSSIIRKISLQFYARTGKVFISLHARQHNRKGSMSKYLRKSDTGM